MAFDMFLKLEGSSGPATITVGGESMDKSFSGWIEVDGYSLGAHSATAPDSRAGGAAGKPQFKELVIRKQIDSATPAFLTALFHGVHFEEAWLCLRKSGTLKTSGDAYFQIHMKLVSIRDIELTGEQGDDVPCERVTFTYGAIEYSYRAQDPSGKLGAEQTSVWSQVLNRATLDTK